jgi:hypothetical protein
MDRLSCVERKDWLDLWNEVDDEWGWLESFFAASQKKSSGASIWCWVFQSGVGFFNLVLGFSIRFRVSVDFQGNCSRFPSLLLFFFRECERKAVVLYLGCSEG